MPEETVILNFRGKKPTFRVIVELPKDPSVQGWLSHSGKRLDLNLKISNNTWNFEIPERDGFPKTALDLMAYHFNWQILSAEKTTSQSPFKAKVQILQKVDNTTDIMYTRDYDQLFRGVEIVLESVIFNIEE